MGRRRARSGAPGASRCTSARTPPRSGRRQRLLRARRRAAPPSGPSTSSCARASRRGPRFFTDLLAEVDASAEALREALWDLVWAGEVTNDAWAPLRAPRLARSRRLAAAALRDVRRGVGSLALQLGAAAQRRAVAGPGSLVAHRARVPRRAPKAPAGAVERRRALAELLLERYGIVTREQVLAEGIKGGFAMLYDTFANLETLGICRRGYFIEGMGGAQFALPGAVERLRALPGQSRRERGGRTLVLAAADPAQPYGAALPWPKREDGTATSRALRAWPARMWCWSRTSPCSTSSAAGAAS